MSEKPYVPPYNITDEIIHLVSEISEKIGIVSIKSETPANPQLRRENQIRSIHSSLAIENNSLSLEQMTDIINGKRVLGVPNEIREVKNAYEVYKVIFTFDPFNIKDMLKSHKILMDGLTNESGLFRSGGVGVFADEQLVHMAPPASIVPKLIDDLVQWAKTADTHQLIKSCVFHYEFSIEILKAAIVPSIPVFTDGNGNVIDSLSSDTINVTMPYTNTSDKAVSLIMLVAVYSPKGTMAHMGSDVKVVEPSQTEIFEVRLDMPQNADGSYALDGYSASVFLWDSKTLVPILDKYNF